MNLNAAAGFTTDQNLLSNVSGAPGVQLRLSIGLNHTERKRHFQVQIPPIQSASTPAPSSFCDGKEGQGVQGALGSWLALPPQTSEMLPLPLCSASLNYRQQRGQPHLYHKGEFKLGYLQKNPNPTVILVKKVSKHPPLSDGCVGKLHSLMKSAMSCWHYYICRDLKEE